METGRPRAYSGAGPLPSGPLALRGEGRLTVSLRKPFGIGFHIADEADEPLVVDVKGCEAKANGVKVPTLQCSGMLVAALFVHSLSVSVAWPQARRAQR